MLYYNELMIVVEKVNELILNIKYKFLICLLYRRYDLILLVVLLCYYLIVMFWSMDNGFKLEKGNLIV